MNDEYEKIFQNTDLCWICEQLFPTESQNNSFWITEKNEQKKLEKKQKRVRIKSVRDHCHTTEKTRGAPQVKCNV